jgi:hypothetical protein
MRLMHFFTYLGFEAGLDPEKLDKKEFGAVEVELREILKTYRGWMSRRNDVAHGLRNLDCFRRWWEVGSGIRQTGAPTNGASLLESPPTLTKQSILMGSAKHSMASRSGCQFFATA